MKKMLLFLLMLALIPIVHASTDLAIATSCESVTAFNYRMQTECLLHSETLTKNRIMLDENDNLMDELKAATWAVDINVDNKGKKSVHTLILVLSTLIFVFITAYTGYLYITSATYPEKREMAKVQLKNLVFVAIAIVAIGPFLTYANDISELTTTLVYKNYFTADDFQAEKFLQEGSTPGNSYDSDLDRYSELSSVSPSFQLAARSYILSMQGRNMMVLTLMAIFPLIIIMFFFQPMQEFGKFFIYLFIIEEFMPVIFVVILAVAQSVLGEVVLGNVALTKMQIISAALLFSVAMHAVLVLLAVFKSAINIAQARRYVTSTGGP